MCWIERCLRLSEVAFSDVEKNFVNFVSEADTGDPQIRTKLVPITSADSAIIVRSYHDLTHRAFRIICTENQDF